MPASPTRAPNRRLRRSGFALALLLGAALCGSAAAASPVPTSPSSLPPTRSLLLAGGALAGCSDLGPGSCAAAPPAGATRLPSTYRLDDAGIARALAPALWATPGAPSREALARMLGDARRALDTVA
ncbi:MAG: hypothetical protein ACRC2H_09515, partial [Silanimonas sp.]